MQVMFKKYSS